MLKRQPPSNDPEKLRQTHTLSLQIADCRLQFAVCRFLFVGHLILDMDLNLKPNVELNLNLKLNQKSNMKLSGYQKLKVSISTMTI